MTRIITDLDELAQALMQDSNWLDFGLETDATTEQVCEHTYKHTEQVCEHTYKHTGINMIHIMDSPGAQHIYVTRNTEGSQYTVEINHSHTGEFMFYNIGMKQVLYLVMREVYGCSQYQRLFHEHQQTTLELNELKHGITRD